MSELGFKAVKGETRVKAFWAVGAAELLWVLTGELRSLVALSCFGSKDTWGLCNTHRYSKSRSIRLKPASTRKTDKQTRTNC